MTAPSGLGEDVREDDPGSGFDDESARLLLGSVKGYAIYLLDPGGHVTSWNAGAESIKGYSAKEIVGKHFSLFYTPEDRAAGEPDRELVSATSTTYETEGWRLRKNGERFWAGVTVTPLFDKSGGLRGFAKITRDMTEQHRAQEQRIRLERAEEALRIRDQFLAGVRRSLDAVLASIRIHVQSLKGTVDSFSGDTPAGIKAKLTTLEWGLDRMSRTIDEVLETTRESAEQLVLQLREDKDRPRRRDRTR
jgi:PAS domain S-box-containing protein